MKIQETTRLFLKILSFVIGLTLCNPAQASFGVDFNCMEMKQNGDLDVEISIDSYFISCNNWLTGQCVFTFDGNFLIKTQGGATVVTYPMYISHTIPFQSSGTNEFQIHTIPASVLNTLVPGTIYELYIELEEGFMQSPFIGPPGVSYDVFSPCWTGNFDTQNADYFGPGNTPQDPPCESLVNTFVYTNPTNQFTWNQNFYWACSFFPVFNCVQQYTLSGTLIAPNHGPNAYYYWFRDGVSIGSGQTLNYKFPNCSVYDVELEVRQYSNTEICINYSRVVDLRNSSECGAPPCCATDRIGKFDSGEIPVSIMPNKLGSTDNLLVNYFLPETGVVEFTIVDLAGKQISTQQISSEKQGENFTKIALPGLASGMYFLKVDNGRALGISKFMIE